MRILRLTAIVALALGACATAPKTASERSQLEARADATLTTMRERDPGLASLLRTSYGYAVFPDIGKGGFIVGGAYGRGILYERGKRIGYVELNQGSLGAQIGGQTFAELIVFRDPHAVQKLKNGEWSMGADASAVAIKAGASAAATFTEEGVAVFTMPRGGLMAELSVSGQKLNYQPKGG